MKQKENRKNRGHPLKGTSQEKKHRYRKKSLFLSFKGDARYQQSLRCRSFLKFRCQSLLHQSPIRIKVGMMELIHRPFPHQRTRKSSVPCRVQWFFLKSHGYQPPLMWLTAWSVKMLITFIKWAGRSPNQVSWFYQPLVRGNLKGGQLPIFLIFHFTLA